MPKRIIPKTAARLLAATALAAIGATATASASATDWSAMRADERVQRELLGASMAYIIDEQCPSIRLRRLRMVGYALSLSRHAKGLGYTSDEIETYVNDKDEQARFRALATERLLEKGAREGDAQSFCEVGRSEMEQETYVGSMLKGG